MSILRKLKKIVLIPLKTCIYHRMLYHNINNLIVYKNINH